MRSTQSRIEQALDEKVTAAGYELTQTSAWANTGKFVVMDGLRVVETWRYDFQGDHASIFPGPTYAPDPDRPGKVKGYTELSAPFKYGGSRIEFHLNRLIACLPSKPAETPEDVRTWSAHRFWCRSCEQECFASEEGIRDYREQSGEDGDDVGTDEEIVSTFEMCLECAAGDDYPGEKVNQLTREDYVRAAKNLHHRDGEIEVDDNAKISDSQDSGEYVAAWVWVSDDEARELRDGVPA